MAKKRFFAKHAKSSAALISIGLHLLIVVIALSYVAVTVIQKDDKTFEAKPCLLYTSPSPRDRQKSRMPSSA